MWFRSDLRISDNAALHAARSEGTDGVVGVFCFCPAQWREHHWGPMKADFVRRSVIELQKSLGQLKIPLKILVEPRFDGVASAVLGLARDLGCGSLHFGREYEVNERKRDRAVVEAFEGAGLRVTRHTNKVIYEPGTIRTKDGGWYSVFTPFKKRLYETWLEIDEPELFGLPKPCRAKVCEGDRVPDALEGYDFAADGATRPDLWPAGEDQARSRLDAFLADGVEQYKDRRDTPAIDGTSALSPYLAVGSICPRRVIVETMRVNSGKLDSGGKGPVHYISEIVWREFYQHLLVSHPRVSKNRNFNESYDGLKWDDDDEAFRAWCGGRTGIPIVDAAMRQLNTTGWMHNRCRMIVAMFLTKNLLQDWRRGERYFMEKLVDGDLASNNGGWQWSSSTGTDAAPYFRVYNPISQSERHDPDGAYIRRFVPELAELDADQIHEPHARAGLFGELDYPEPIVDLKASRERAIAVFKAYRAGDEEVRVI